jgi:soluble lytic murein transglycosylase-like protein
MLCRKALLLARHTVVAIVTAGVFCIRGANATAADAGDYETPPPGQISVANKKRLTPLVERIAHAHGIQAALVHALISAESGYDPHAVSANGAIGLMQLLPVTARHYGVKDADDLFDPDVNVTAGTRHLKVLLKKYRNISHALAAYNAGEGAVDRQRRRISYLESRKFTVRVIKFYWQYKGGANPVASCTLSSRQPRPTCYPANSGRRFVLAAGIRRSGSLRPVSSGLYPVMSEKRRMMST